MSAETQKKRIATFIASEWHRLVGFVRAWIAELAEEISDSRYEAGEALDRAEARETMFAVIDALPDAARKHRAIRSLRKTLTGGTI